MHRLAANVIEVGQYDTEEDSLLHVFRTLRENRFSTDHMRDIQLDWIKNSYGDQRVASVISNKPLMTFLSELMRYNYFEYDGKIPVTMYQMWSKCIAPEYGARGSVSAVVYCFMGILLTINALAGHGRNLA